MKGPRGSIDAGTRWSGAALALGLHALALAFALSYEPARGALLAAAPIMVSLVVPPKPEPRPQPVTRPRPQPPEAPPVLSAPAESPALLTALPPPVEPPAPAPEPAPQAAATPVAVTPPIFNADYLDNPAPEYPRISRHHGEQGRVVLRVLVNAAGRADDIEVRSSSGFVRLDEAARDTVRQWRFVPATRGDTSVPAWVLIPISFRLEG